MVLVVILKVVLNEFELLVSIFCTKRHFCLISNMTIFRWLTISRAKSHFYDTRRNMVTEQVLIAAYDLIHYDWTNALIIQTIY